MYKGYFSAVALKVS